jgi:putative addiction module killer protein
MVQVRRTERFARWLDTLRDVRGRARIQARIERLAAGNPGDVAPVGERVSELRIDVGPGYRVYFTRRGRAVIILLRAAASTRRPLTSEPRCSWRAACRSSR